MYILKSKIQEQILKMLNLFLLLLGSHLMLGQWKDDPVEGWLHHFIILTLYQQQPCGDVLLIVYIFTNNTAWKPP